jgi:sec-independent protein translocase protein TatC
MTDPEKPEESAGGESGFMSHLLELRNRLLYALIAIGLVFLALAPFSNEVYALLARPLLSVLPKGASMIATEVASPFLTPIRLTLAVAFVVAIPYVLYQVWAFVAPGLYGHEKRIALPLLLSSIVLFYAGMAFAYFAVFPVAFGFFAHSAPEGVVMMTDIKSYLDFVFSMFFAFGVAFEIPVAVVILSHLGIVDPEVLARSRSYVVLGAFIVAAVLTPPDVFSQVLLAIPMIGLFEIGLFFARRLKAASAAQDDPTLPESPRRGK